ncbi:MAG: gliding motility-associated C-terminal domain-containing protein, partial [Bacteroidetes bacterium]|nr:gliding motility-associated C-terminal domain-containing protein [Bacteroidota bacterium]
NWSNGLTTPNIVVNANFANTPNVYSVSVTDNCSLPNATAGFTVNVNPIPTGSFVSSINKGCAPLSVNFTAIQTSNNGSVNNYIWNFNGGSQGNEQINTGTTATVFYPNAGTFNVVLTTSNQFGCSSVFNIANYVEVYPVPIAEFVANPQMVSLLDPNVEFINQSQGASSYIWDFGDFNYSFNSSVLPNPNHTYQTVGIYDVFMVAINSFGCSDTVTHKIEVKPDFAFYIPNAFTPDQNNHNDVFLPKGVGISEDKYKMEIFDRWGELIFSSNAFRTGWDGTVKGSGQIAQDGVYIYKIWVTDLEGRKKYYVGHVTLLKQ